LRAIVGWCLRNKPVVILAAVLLVVSGVFATTRLNQELLPDISFPIVTISTPVEGAGPEVVDEQVTQTIESAISGVGGVQSVQSTSSRGFSLTVVEFGLDTDTEEAEADLQAALEGVTLPQGAGQPEVRGQSASEFPILYLSLSAPDGDLARLTEYAREEIVPELEGVEGVGRVDLVGGAEERIDVRVDPERLREALPAAVIAGAVSGASVDAPVGTVPLDGRSTSVRATSELRNIGDLRDLPVGVAGAATGVGAAAAQGGAPQGAAQGAPSGAPAGGAPPGGASASGAGGAPSGGAPSGGESPGGAPPGAVGGGASAGGAAFGQEAEAPEPVPLRDLADVERVPSEVAGISRTNGEPSLNINITKEVDANTVEVAEGVQRALGEARRELGRDQVTVVYDSATDVESAVSGLVEEGLIGAALAIVVIFAFLRSLRATLVTAVSLPTSVLAALLFSWGEDLTLNILTLAGLTIAVGRVVDDAIVVLENSYRYVQQGYGAEEAALKGTTEVASAITSSTLTTTAVFVPLGLVGGIVSKFFVPLSLTVALALLASLIVAVTIIPVLVSLFLKRGSNRAPRTGAPNGDPRLRRVSGRRRTRGSGLARFLAGVLVFLAASAVAIFIASRAGVLGEVPGLPRSFVGRVDGFVSGLDLLSPAFLAAVSVAALVLALLLVLLLRRAGGRRVGGSEGDGLLVRLYTPVLRWSLRHRLAVLALAIGAFVGGLALVPLLEQSFFPPGDERLVQAEVELDPGTGIERTSRRIEELEEYLRDQDAVEDYQVSIGGEDTFGGFGEQNPENRAQAFIRLGEEANARRFASRLNDEGRRLYGEGFQAQVVTNGPPQGGLEAVLTGGSEGELRRASDLVEGALDDLSGVENVNSDIAGGTPEVNVDVDPERATEKGLSATDVSRSLGLLLSDAPLTTIGETPVVLTLPDRAVDTVGEVRRLPLGPGVDVGDVADVREVDSPAAISRFDGDRAVTVSANITSTDTQSVSQEARAAIDRLDLPDGVSARVGGETEDIDESFRNLFYSIIVALALVYLVLVVFFGSLLVPVVILLAVPLTTVGAFGALYLTDTALSLPSLLGILLLIGIVVANAILLVDFANKAREHHASVDEALIEAGRARLRPILMTALATIFALLPLALGLSGAAGGALVSSSLAITVIGGLVTSTFLTLLVVPVGYSLLKGGRRKKKGAFSE
jgi:HAE1 family hydrophobic/amphiphilic exporter-1